MILKKRKKRINEVLKEAGSSSSFSIDTGALRRHMEKSGSQAADQPHLMRAARRNAGASGMFCV